MTAVATDIGAARAVDAVKTYGVGEAAINALAGVTVTFPKGRFTAIMGPSGSGKSTLMQCVAGLDRLTSGSAFIGETELSGLNKTELTLLRRDRLGFIFQQYNLISTLTARENIVLPLTLAGEDADPAWFDEIVKTVGLGNRLDNLPSQLSGGQQQRVAVARALVPRPEIVFADEPTGALDSRTGIEILTFMRTAVDDLRPDHRDGHPRPPRGVVRRQRPVPRRRPDHRRDARAHDRPRARPDEAVRGLMPAC